PDLPLGASGSVTYQVQLLAADVNPNTFTNAATIRSAEDDHNLTDNNAAVTTTVVVRAISGTVWNDVNGNGSADAGEPGLSGVTVNRTGTGSPTTTITDASGHYAFSALTNTNTY